MNNNDDNTLNSMGLMWRGKKEFWVKEQLSDELLDHNFLKHVNVVKDLVKTNKRTKDLALCNKWMGILLRTTKEEKYARNWLLKLMLRQLKNGGMCYPFTDPQNSNRDVCRVLKDYETTMKMDVDKLSSPLELKVPEPSSASLEQVPSRKSRSKSQSYERPWRDVFSSIQPVEKLSKPIEIVKEEEQNSQVLHLYFKENYKQPNSTLDIPDSRNIRVTFAPSTMTLGKKPSQISNNEAFPDRAERDQLERQRKLRDIGIRKEREQLERRNREKQRQQQRAKEAEKRKLQEQLLERERMQKEKDHKELLFKVHQRREEERIRREGRKGLPKFQTPKTEPLINRLQVKEKRPKRDLKPQPEKLENPPTKEIPSEKPRRQSLNIKSVLRQQKIEELNEQERQLAEELKKTEREVIYLQKKQKEAKMQKAQKEKKLQKQPKIVDKNLRQEIQEKSAENKAKLQIIKQKLEVMENAEKQSKEVEEVARKDKKMEDLKETKIETGKFNLKPPQKVEDLKETKLKADNLNLNVRQKVKFKEKPAVAQKNLESDSNEVAEKLPQNNVEPHKVPNESKTVLIDLPRSKSEPAFRVKVSDYGTEIGLEFENIEEENSVETERRKDQRFEEKLSFKLHVDKQRNRLQLAEAMIHKIDKEKKQLEREINARSQILEWLKVPEHQNRILGETRLKAGVEEVDSTSNPCLLNFAYQAQMVPEPILKSPQYYYEEMEKSSQSSGEYFNVAPQPSKRKRWVRFMETKGSVEDQPLSSSCEDQFLLDSSSEGRRAPKSPRVEEQKSRTLIDFTRFTPNLEKSLRSSEPIRRRISQLYERRETNLEQTHFYRPVNRRVPQLRQQYEEKLEQSLDEHLEREKSELELWPPTREYIRERVYQLRRKFEQRFSKAKEEDREKLGGTPHSLTEKKVSWDQQKTDALDPENQKELELEEREKQEVKFDPDEVRRYLKKYRQVVLKKTSKTETSKLSLASKDHYKPIGEQKSGDLKSSLVSKEHDEPQGKQQSSKAEASKSSLASKEHYKPIGLKKLNQSIEKSENPKFDPDEVRRYLEKYRCREATWSSKEEKFIKEEFIDPQRQEEQRKSSQDKLTDKKMEKPKRHKEEQRKSSQEKLNQRKIEKSKRQQEEQKEQVQKSELETEKPKEEQPKVPSEEKFDLEREKQLLLMSMLNINRKSPVLKNQGMELVNKPQEKPADLIDLDLEKHLLLMSKMRLNIQTPKCRSQESLPQKSEVIKSPLSSRQDSQKSMEQLAGISKPKELHKTESKRQQESEKEVLSEKEPEEKFDLEMEKHLLKMSMLSVYKKSLDPRDREKQVQLATTNPTITDDIDLDMEKHLLLMSKIRLNRKTKETHSQQKLVAKSEISDHQKSTNKIQTSDQLKAFKRQRHFDFIELKRKHERKQLSLLAAKICSLALKREVKDIFKQFKTHNNFAYDSSKLMRKHLHLAIKLMKLELRKLQRKLRKRLQKRGLKCFQLQKNSEIKEKSTEIEKHSQFQNLQSHLRKMKRLLIAEFRPICNLTCTSSKLSIMKELATRCFSLLNTIFRNNINCEKAWLDALKIIEQLYFQQLQELETNVAPPQSKQP